MQSLRASLKRAAPPGSVGTSDPPRKVSRLSADDVLRSFAEAEAALGSLDPMQLSERQLSELQEASCRISHLVYMGNAEHERRRSRPAETTLCGVSLSADILEMVMSDLSPKHLAGAAMASRAFASAVQETSRARLRAFGEELIPGRRVDFEKLSRIEKQAAEAPALVASLTQANFEKLHEFEPCVLRRELPKLSGLKLDNANVWRIICKAQPTDEWFVANSAQMMSLLTEEVLNDSMAHARPRAGLFSAVTSVITTSPQWCIEKHAAELTSILRLPKLLTLVQSSSVEVEFESSFESSILKIPVLYVLLALRKLPPSKLADVPDLRESVKPYLENIQLGASAQAVLDNLKLASI